MSEESTVFSANLPSKQKFANVLYILGRIGFWVQLLLGFASTITLFLVIFSRNFSTQDNSNFIGLGIFLAIAALVALGFRVYWAWRYTRLAKLLQKPDKRLHPKRQEVIEVLRVGLIVSATGLLLAFLATEITAVSVLAKSLSQPQGVAVYSPEKIVRSLDIFLILANVNLIGAHFLGSLNSLGLINWITR